MVNKSSIRSIRPFGVAVQPDVGETPGSESRSCPGCAAARRVDAAAPGPRQTFFGSNQMQLFESCCRLSCELVCGATCPLMAMLTWVSTSLPNFCGWEK